MQLAHKPGSVLSLRLATIIYLGYLLPDTSSGST